MAEKNDSKPDEKPKAAEKPAVTSITLDRTYLYEGKYYGPGDVQVSGDLADNLIAAVERSQAAKAESVDVEVAAFNAAEEERRKFAEKTGRR